MPYRNEHEALKSKVELLEAELTREKARAATLEETASRAEELEAALEHVETQLRTVRGETPFRRPTMGIAFAFAMSAIVASSMIAMRGAREASIVYVPRPMTTAPPMLPIAPAVGPLAPFAPRAYHVRATEVIGDAPVEENDYCDVLVAPTNMAPACRVTVSCGGEIVFGGEGLGYLDCELVGGEPTVGADVVGLADEGDPMLDMSLVEKRIVVSNDRPATWAFTLYLETPARSAEAAADERADEAQY